MKKYYIYHIPTFIHKDGRIGKIGCTEEEDAKVRVENQGYTEYEILETHTDIMIVSDREIELQKQYGYPVDSCPYYKTREIPTQEGCKKGGNTAGKINAEKEGYMANIGSISASKQWKENRERELQKCSKGGRKNVELGILQSVSSKGGITSSSIKRTCPYCGLQSNGAGYARWHGERCKHKPTAT